MSPGVELLIGAMGIWFSHENMSMRRLLSRLGDLIFGLGQVVEVRDWETAELILNQYPQKRLKELSKLNSAVPPGLGFLFW
jgi:hypothetical protein